MSHPTSSRGEADLARSLPTLFRELIYGAASDGAYILNAGDRGLIDALEGLSAATASATHGRGASVAAHVEHLRYGLSLLNRWAAGEHPFDDAHWAASWERTTVSEEEWSRLRQALRGEAERWLACLQTPREMSDVERNGAIASVVHLAYHLGALRQMDPTLRGPGAND